MTIAAQLTERHKWVLKFLAANPGASTNAIYVNTSPACIAYGRRKSFGSEQFVKTMDRLKAFGLVTLTVDTSRSDRAVFKALEKTRTNGKIPSTMMVDRIRRQNIIRRWELTMAGAFLAATLPAVREGGQFKGKSYAIVLD